MSVKRYLVGREKNSNTISLSSFLCINFQFDINLKIGILVWLFILEFCVHAVCVHTHTAHSARRLEIGSGHILVGRWCL